MPPRTDASSQNRQDRPLTTRPNPGDGAGRTWVIVQAGGEGERLRPPTELVSGDRRRTPYARLAGSRSLLQQTLARTALTIPLQEFLASERRWILMPPEDRGTAAALLRISWRDVQALVVLFPADHFRSDQVSFMTHVVGVASFVRRRPDRLVLRAATPTEPDRQYGWIQPGRPIGAVAPEPVVEVRGFRERPARGEVDLLWWCGAATGGKHARGRGPRGHARRDWSSAAAAPQRTTRQDRALRGPRGRAAGHQAGVPPGRPRELLAGDPRARPPGPGGGAAAGRSRVGGLGNPGAGRREPVGGRGSPRSGLRN